MLAAVLLFSLKFHQASDVDLYGKTNTEVLKMGEAAWFKFYTAHAGDSTAAMTSAYGIYGDIASHRNDQLVANPHLPNRTKIKQLRKLLANLGGNIASIGSAITGGGTMWNTVAAQQYAETEDAVYALIHPKGQALAKHVHTSDFLKAIAQVPSQLKSTASEGVLTPENHKSALADLEETKVLYRQIVQIASGFDRPTSDRILGFCLDQAQLLKSL